MLLGNLIFPKGEISRERNEGEKRLNKKMIHIAKDTGKYHCIRLNEIMLVKTREEIVKHNIKVNF